MNKFLTLTSSLLVVACGHAFAQRSNDQLLRRNEFPMQQARPAEAAITSPAAMLQFLFPGYKPGLMAPAAARQIQPNTKEATLASGQPVPAAASKEMQSVKPASVAIPSQGQQPSTIYTPTVPKK